MCVLKEEKNSNKRRRQDLISHLLATCAGHGRLARGDTTDLERNSQYNTSVRGKNASSLSRGGWGEGKENE